jgi:hypothetical protein
LLIWAANPEQEAELAELPVGGTVPDREGPFAMAVVNNGGGDKLDAYLKVDTSYDPGPCREDVRLGDITVTLTNGAPSRGLPDYVSVRSDLVEKSLPNPMVGSNRILLDVYGPVGASAPIALVDGQVVSTVNGTDRGHSVWRIDVVVEPGHRSTVKIVVAEPVTEQTRTATPVVRIQPMVIPGTATAKMVQPCTG